MKDVRMRTQTIVKQAEKMAEDGVVCLWRLAKKLDQRGFCWCLNPSNQTKWYDALEQLLEEGYSLDY